MLRSTDYADEYKVKIIIVGDSGVGKTNIREKLCQNKFDPFSVKTIGVQYSTRRFYAPFQQKMQRFVVCFWDVIGQLSNPDLLPAYFKNVLGVIYVFDLTNQESLNNVKLWKNKIQEHNSSKIVELLLGNKKDLKHLREVKNKDAEDVRREMNISQYSQVSALEESGGIHEAIYQYFTTISNQFNFGLKKPNKIRKPQERHRSCI